MRILTARIKPLEPLMLRGTGEFDPSARGVYSYASSLEIPRPSTFVGMMLSHFISSTTLSISVTRWRDMLELYNKALDELGIEGIRGPYIYDVEQDKVYVSLRLFKSLSLVEYRQLSYYLSYRQELNVDVLSLLFNGVSGRCDLYVLKKVEDLLHDFELKLKHIERLGIGLKDREEGVKTAYEKRGYIYTAKYVAYPENIELRFKLLITNDNQARRLMLGDGVAVKFGGEHRVSRLIIDDTSDELDYILLHTPLKYALLLSPTPLKTVGGGIEYIGELSVIGLGFSIARRKRKPLYPAVLEGSILRIKTGQELDSNTLLKHGLYPVLGLRDKEYYILGRLGYSSFAPLMNMSR